MILKYGETSFRCTLMQNEMKYALNKHISVINDIIHRLDPEATQDKATERKEQTDMIYKMENSCLNLNLIMAEFNDLSDIQLGTFKVQETSFKPKEFFEDVGSQL